MSYKPSKKVLAARALEAKLEAMKLPSENRVLEMILGRDNAEKAIRGYAASFKNSNDRELQISASGLEATDPDGGSGEFWIARSVNSNESDSAATDVFQIECLW